MFDNILKLTLGVFVGAWVARYLGPDNFGLFNYALSFSSVFIIFSGLGLDGILVRELVKNEKEKTEILGTGLGLKVFGSLLCVLLVGLILLFSKDDIVTKTLIIIVTLPVIFSGLNVLDYYFQSKVKSKNKTLITSGVFVLSSVIKILMIKFKLPLIYFAELLLLESLLIAAGFVWIYRLSNPSFLNKWRFKFDYAKQLLKESWPLLLSGFAITIYMKIDQIMLKMMLGNEAVGFYSAALKISEVWYFIPISICSSIFPAIVESKNLEINSYYNRMVKLYSLMIYLAIIIAIVISLFSSQIIHILYGDLYKDSDTVLIVHVWACLPVFIGVASAQWLINENLQVYSFYSTMLGALINIGLNIILIPLYGIIGCAISTFVSYFMSAYLALFFFKKARVNFYLISRAFTFSVYKS